MCRTLTLTPLAAKKFAPFGDVIKVRLLADMRGMIDRPFLNI
jgi:ureidoglycolate hydrolase